MAFFVALGTFLNIVSSLTDQQTNFLRLYNDYGGTLTSEQQQQLLTVIQSFAALTPEQQAAQIDLLKSTISSNSVSSSGLSNPLLKAILIKIPFILLEAGTRFLTASIGKDYLTEEKEILTELKKLLQTLQAIQSQGLGMA